MTEKMLGSELHTLPTGSVVIGPRKVPWLLTDEGWAKCDDPKYRTAATGLNHKMTFKILYRGKEPIKVGDVVTKYEAQNLPSGTQFVLTDGWSGSEEEGRNIYLVINDEKYVQLLYPGSPLKWTGCHDDKVLQITYLKENS